jgi:hypothetical protein
LSPLLTDANNRNNFNTPKPGIEKTVLIKAEHEVNKCHKGLFSKKNGNLLFAIDQTI